VSKDKMEKRAVGKVCRRVYRKFPTLRKKRPKISERPGDNYLLVFEGSGETPDGRKIKQVVRVVASAAGRIIKMSSSR
jgi:hypothetical protein